MAELIDRSAQREILQVLAETYPNEIDFEQIASRCGGNRVTAINLAYLSEYDLVAVEWDETLGVIRVPAWAQITARGIDFLADDGGLSAILGVVTVKLHEETLKDLVAAKIQASDLPEPERRRFVDQLRQLPAEATRHLVMKLLDAGLDNWHRALPLLQNSLGV